jgi:hypothetical protein
MTFKIRKNADRADDDKLENVLQQLNSKGVVIQPKIENENKHKQV